MRDAHQEAVGARIARLREQQGWSQRALARWVGLDQSAVSRIEAGHRRLSAEELQRIAHALRVSADDLLRAPGLPASPAMADRPDQTPGPGESIAAGIPGVLEDGLYTLATGPGPEEAAEVVLRTRPRAPAEKYLSTSGTAHLMTHETGFPQTTRQTERLGFAPGVDLPRLDVGGRSAPRRSSPAVAGLPGAVAAVVGDWFGLRTLAEAPEPALRWRTGHSAEGKPERIAHASASMRPGAPPHDVLYDRVARFWRSELHVEPDDGPLPDLVPLLEDGYGVQVVVARVAGEAGAPDGATVSSERPVAASFTVGGVPFAFVNAARPVVLQRFALAHAFAHHVLGHGDVTDRRIEWSRSIPPEAAANDFAEEFLAPVRAVQRWYERRDVPRRMRLEDLLALANAFGISAWAALYRSRAAGRLRGRRFHALSGELRRVEWELLPRQAYLGGLRDTLSHLTPGEVLPRGSFGGPAVLRVPAPMRAWALAALQGGRLSLEEAAASLHLEASAFADQLARLGLE